MTNQIIITFTHDDTLVMKHLKYKPKFGIFGGKLVPKFEFGVVLPKSKHNMDVIWKYVVDMRKIDPTITILKKTEQIIVKKPVIYDPILNFETRITSSNATSNDTHQSNII